VLSRSVGGMRSTGRWFSCSAFVTLFVVIRRVRADLLQPHCRHPPRRLDIRSSLIAGAVLIAFALGGETFLSLGITLPAFKSLAAS
jgi:small neutral amino acid transporter SnatA (MarC family)